MKRGILFISYYFIVHFAIGLKDDISVVDSRLDNIEELDLPELLNVSLSSELGYEQANIVYKRKYGDKAVQIGYFVSEGVIYTHPESILVSHRVAGNFLKAFGESIETLSISYSYIHEDILQEIGRQANLYCSETLKEFQARFFREGTFNDMQKPFNKVERVVFDGKWEDLKENSLSPDKLFPKISAMDLTYSDGVIFDYHYPHLVDLKSYYITPSSGFIKFIEKNPQIKKLYLQGLTSVELLKTVSDKLLELDVLEFRWPNDFLSYPNLVIQFNHVKEASIYDLHIRSGNISFEQLEKLQLTVNEELDDTWTDFIIENKKLKTLTTGKLNDSTLLTLSSNLNSLIEANLSFDSNIQVETIVQFLESSSEMEKMTINLANGSLTFFDSLKEKLENKWNVATTNGSFDNISLTKLETSSIVVKDDISIVDSRLDNLDDLDIPELLNVSLSSNLGYQQANIVYKRKYADKPVEIDYFVSDGVIHLDRSSIHVSHIVAGDLIKAFGESIETLSISYFYIYEDILQEIERLANLYCSETLTEIQARFFEEGTFHNFQKPFNKVERVVFDGKWKELKENSLSPDKLFPKVCAFDLTYSDGVIFDYHYPHLVELKIQKNTLSDGFIKFIEKNPQIKKLYLQSSSSVEVLKTVSENLLELEVLEFHWPNDFLSNPDLMIQFNHVKEASIKNYNPSNGPENILFKELEKLEMPVFGELNETWINFIAKNKQLNSLTAGEFTDPTLITLSSELNSLVEANLNFDSSVEVETIVKFLESNLDMKKITLNLFNGSFFDSLNEKLKMKWNVTPLNMNLNKINLTKLEMPSIAVKSDISAVALKDDISVVDNRLDKIEELDLLELMNVSLSSDLGYRQANILYKWKYGDEPVEIGFLVYNSALHIGNGTIYISHSIVESFLKAFGKSIGKLTMLYNQYLETENREKGRLINLYCSETLTEFKAQFIQGSEIDVMEKPFEKVESVTFNGEWKELKENTLSPDKMFPNMRSLNLTYSNGVIFDYHYQHLVELKTYIPSSSRFMKFIERNPQIKKLFLEHPYPSVELLKTVSDKLPELEVLELSWPYDCISYPDLVINFNSVKEASIIGNHNIRSGNITFKQLERLQLTLTGRLDDEWIHFITQNKQLKTLTAGKFNVSTLVALSSSLNSLIEANLHFDSNVEVESVLHFLENNSQVKKMTLNLAKRSITFFDSLSKKLKGKWNVAPDNKSFNKINLINLKMPPDTIGSMEGIQHSTNEENSTGISIVSTENSTHNVTDAESASENKAHIFSSTIFTVLLTAIIVNVFTI